MQQDVVISKRELFRRLHPRLASWFRGTFPDFTDAQLRCVPSILRHESILLTSPTGSGKTLAAFLGVFDQLLRLLDGGQLSLGVHCVYVSPLRALTYDIGKNLRAPISGMGLEKELLIHVRTGDTSASDRAKFRRRPAHFLVTTPESLAVQLAQESYAAHLSTCRFVIVDELHSFAGNKRGVDLALSLERLEELVRHNGGLCRVGLSATAAPLDLLARFLAGDDRPCHVAQARIEKESIVEVFSPIRRKPYPPAGYTGVRLYAELAELIRSRQSVLVFTNVRSAAEQIGLRLKELLPDLADCIEIHHASLDRSVRLEVEDRLKDGELRAVVCSTSLELGIDIGAVDLVVMVATPKGVSRAIQRIGRSGHSLNKSSHGVLVATNINDLVEATATARLVRQGVLDPIKILEKPNDVLAQHVVGMAALAPTGVEEAFAIVRRAYPYRELERGDFERVLEYLAGGGESLQQQYASLFGKIVVEEGVISLATSRVAREFLVNIGTIVSEGFVTVLLGRRRLGSVEEGFIKQLQMGDLFVLGGRVVRLIESGVQEVRVERADGQIPTIPRWNAAKMPLTSGLAKAVRELRAELDARSNECLIDRGDRVAGRELPNVIRKRAADGGILSAPSCALSEVPVGRSVSSSSTAKASIPLFLSCAHWPQRERRAFAHRRLANEESQRRQRARHHRRLRISSHLAPVPGTAARRMEGLFSTRQGGRGFACRAARIGAGEMAIPGRRANRIDGAAQFARPRAQAAQLSWSSEMIFRVLEQHEPDHPLLEEAYRQATQIFLDAEKRMLFSSEVQSYRVAIARVTGRFAIFVSDLRQQNQRKHDVGGSSRGAGANLF